MASTNILAVYTLLANLSLQGPEMIGWAVLGLLIAGLLMAFACVRFIPNNRVGIVEKLWGPRSLAGGHLIALDGEAGYQADLLRGGMHFGYWRWQYRIHQVALVTIPQGKIGYVYARDGEPLQPGQTLGRVVSSNNFQDARAFLGDSDSKDETTVGQRGRQRAILREGVYAINLALFIVITEDAVFRLNLGGQKELETVMTWQKELREVDGFSPVVIGAPIETRDPFNPDKKTTVDSIGIVTVHDGPSLPPGEIIAPGVGNNRGQ